MKKKPPTSPRIGSSRAPDGRKNANKPRVQSATRTAEILMAVARGTNGLKAFEICDQLQLSRQVTYHLLHSLVSVGMLRRNERNRYILGLAAGVIAEGFARQLAPPEHLGPLVREAAASTGETSYAVGWVDGDIAVLATARGYASSRTADLPHGTYNDAHARASGKLLLALADAPVQASFFATHSLTARTDHTFTERDALEREFSKIAEERFAFDAEEYVKGVCCLAVPVAASGDRFAIAISAPSERLRTNMERYLAALRVAANLGT